LLAAGLGRLQGALFAADTRRRRIDVLGVLVIGLIVALGGSLLRDVVLNQPPVVVWMNWYIVVAGVDFAVRTVPLRPDGSGEYADLWAAQLRCDTGMSGDPVSESATVQSPLQKAAVAAAKSAGYGEHHKINARSSTPSTKEAVRPAQATTTATRQRSAMPKPRKWPRT
jgi:hypothetical protein